MNSIDDKRNSNPRFHGTLHGVRLIWQDKGIRGIFQGLLPTVARQAATSAIRFGSYTSIKQLAQSYVAPGERLGSFATFGIGGIAGAVTVYFVSIANFCSRLIRNISVGLLWN